MLYISGKRETLKSLREQEEFQGPLSDYEQKFTRLNPHIKITHASEPLPEFTPLYLVSQHPKLVPYRQGTAEEFGRYTLAERQTLRDIQENEIDLPIAMAGQDLLDDYKSVIPSVRKFLYDPIIKTPWQYWNESVTNDSILDVISEGAFYQSNSIQLSPLYRGLDSLERNMVTMDALQTQLHPLRGKVSSKSRSVKQGLKRRINDLSPQIKHQVYPKLENHLSKHLGSRYSPLELQKMTRKSFGEKMMRKGKLKTTHLDLLNRTELGRMRQMIPLFKDIGKKAGKYSVCLGWASVGMDTLDAANNQGLAKALRTATSSSTGLLAGTAVTAYIIGAAGTTFLIATPFGWALVIVGGIALGNYVGNSTSEVVDWTFDRGIELATAHPQEASKIAKAASHVTDFFYSLFEKIGQDLIRE